MKFAKMFALAAALVAVSAIVSAHAVPLFSPTGVQDVVQLPDGTYYNVAGHFSCDNAGHPLTSDAYRDRDNWIVYTNAINDTISIGALLNARQAAGSTNAGFCAESTTVYPCASYKKFTLMLRVIPGSGATGDTTSNIRLAVEVRKHIAQVADSASTFVWSGWNTSPTYAATDSIGQGYGPTISSSPGTVALYPGEHLIVFNPKQRGDRNTDYFFGPPDGIALDLVDSKGQWFWAPYISVRVRVLSGSATVANKPRVIMHLAMGS